jgi:hypothetical protein
LRALWWRRAAGQRAAGRREGFVLPALLQPLRPPIAAPGPHAGLRRDRGRGARALRDASHHACP